MSNHERNPKKSWSYSILVLYNTLLYNSSTQKSSKGKEAWNNIIGTRMIGKWWSIKLVQIVGTRLDGHDLWSTNLEKIKWPQNTYMVNLMLKYLIILIHLFCPACLKIFLTLYFPSLNFFSRFWLFGMFQPATIQNNQYISNCHKVLQKMNWTA